MNDKLPAENNKVLKRIFDLDVKAFMPGDLDIKTKELLGLVVSAVMHCNDCINFRLESFKSTEEG